MGAGGGAVRGEVVVRAFREVNPPERAHARSQVLGVIRIIGRARRLLLGDRVPAAVVLIVGGLAVGGLLGQLVGGVVGVVGGRAVVHLDRAVVGLVILVLEGILRLAPVVHLSLAARSRNSRSRAATPSVWSHNIEAGRAMMCTKLESAYLDTPVVDGECTWDVRVGKSEQYPRSEARPRLPRAQ